MQTTINTKSMICTKEVLNNVNDELTIALTDYSYSPKSSDWKKDWVHSVAAPAFKEFKNKNYDINSFCTIGTGAGLDAIAAIEILTPSEVTITDIHNEVVSTALSNIKLNLKDNTDVKITGYTGDLMSPFTESDLKFDLIYENLPNIPATDTDFIFTSQNSSSFIKERQGIPFIAKQLLLESHYSLLISARKHLTKNGKILCSIGGRCSLAGICAMFIRANYWPKILTYNWKIQSEPDEVIGGYSASQKAGYGPFYFYPVEALEKTFSSVQRSDEHAQAYQLENCLSKYAITPHEAMKRSNAGQEIGHTVVVIEASPI
ncbi:hypothetical protein [Maridesulfovibrio zosterae]|uniref:hypothetical protein n=1 Tax=Maridesulfovibrio zosterae TaxID=82171 RepID=UPI00041E3BA9|nr:hypothetical protein [Maridesulfovibrio zosterae]